MVTDAGGAAENSDVSPLSASVAVTVSPVPDGTSPTLTVKVALPAASVVTLVVDSHTLPWRGGSATGLSKTSKRYCRLARPWNWIVRTPPATDVSSGKGV